MPIRWLMNVDDVEGPVDPHRTVAVLPLSASEQHGPHLPVSTDADIAHGLLARAADLLPAQADALFLPVEAVGASREHERFGGLDSVSTPELMTRIEATGSSLSARGVHKLLLISSHGGNVSAMTASALNLRADDDMFVVTTTWMRLGLPDGLIDTDERAIGIHGGQIETSLMLHFRPELVDMGRAENFGSAQSALVDRHELLRAHGPVGFGWLAGDLNRQGVVGNAAAASAETGAAIATYQAERFCQLLGEMADVDRASLFGMG
ncbi:MAG: creatininase family protein [Alphaproteobacteria bacterium]